MMRLSRVTKLVLLLVLSVGAVFAYRFFTGRPLIPIAEKLGKELYVDETVISPIWSADGREIYFIGMGQPGEFWPSAINAATGKSRRLTDKPVEGFNTGRHATRLSSDGKVLYFVVSGDNRPLDYLYRIPVSGGEAALIVKDMTDTLFAISDDQRFVAYVKEAYSLVVFNTETGDERVVETFDNLGEIRLPFGFSPDNQLLLWRTANSSYGPSLSEIWLFSFKDGMKRRLPNWPFTTIPVAVAPEVKWAQGSPELLVVYDEGGKQKTSVFSSLTGHQQGFKTVPKAESGPWSVTWLPDSNIAAAWTPIKTLPLSCPEEEGPIESVCINRPKIHWRLYLWDERSNWNTIAETVNMEGVRWLSFSPEGHSLGYQLFYNLYVQKL